MKILVTGAAGFIGYFLSKKLYEAGFEVTGIDNINNYYDINLKNDRLADLKQNCPEFRFIRCDLADKESLEDVFKSGKFDYAVNLAAQAGVRYSLTNPDAYLQSNMAGFLNILECCRNYPVKHLIYASSSSVYGMNKKAPFSESDSVDHPVSLYAATKKSNELMAHSYSHLFNIPVSGLRFFTVYGPFGRPDMAYFLFAKAIYEGRPIDVFNNGDMLRDFTYVDDVVEGIRRLIPLAPEKNDNWDYERNNCADSWAPYRIYNIGNNSPEKLMDFINVLEDKIGIKAVINYKPMQAGDVYMTYADINNLNSVTGYKPSTSIEEGLGRFVDWYRAYYKK
ncbi:MAG: NAD-dependent epimerase [Spirochaetes bacterium]|nr:NAD-dependent epimerase [Spirochaetota bacterium]